MLNFNGISLPSYIKVKEISNPVLPSISQNTVKVSGKPGLISFKNEIDSKIITVTVSIIADSPSDLRSKVRSFAAWLYSDKPQKLILANDPTVYYMAQVSGDTNLDEILKVGQGEIQFICHDPFAYGLQEKAQTLNFKQSDIVNVINTGQHNAYPLLSFTFSQNTTSFNVITGNEVMSFGENNIDKVTIDPTPLVFHDPMESASGWASATNIDGTGSVITGNTFTSNGWSVSASNFGQGTAWHGPSGVKSIGASLQDFAMRSTIGLQSGAVGQLGRIQIYGLDINNSEIFMISLRQGNPDQIQPYAQVKIGSKFYAQTYGNHAKEWGSFLEGKMEIARRGNTWSFYYATKDANGKDSGMLTDKFIVSDLGNNNKPLAKIQIHIGAHGEADPSTYMYISDIKVFNENIQVQQTQTPVIFKKGDTLLIDSETDGVFLNGKPYFSSLNPSSSFPVLEKGANGLSISPKIVESATIKYKERFW